MEMIKIRLQAQRHSLADPFEVPKYRNVGHAAYTIIKEEGVGALYRGVTLTAARQATNQAVNVKRSFLLKDLSTKYLDILLISSPFTMKSKNIFLNETMVDL